MGRVLIIGAGGVGSVVVKKCAMNGDVFTSIMLASRTKEKCDRVREEIKKYIGVDIETAKVDADNVPELVALIRKFKPNLVINVALPYQDLTIMDACLETGVNYMDTANYEPLDEAKFEYKWQWAYQDKFKKKGIMALLGAGFDPGVTNVYCAYAQKHLFDEIKTIDILDCNAGSHGKAFATNFNPEINIREVTQRARHWKNGKWVETPAIIEEGSVHFSFDYPVVGHHESYLLYHEEMESLVKHIKGLERIRFWMTFGQQYLTHLKVLQNVGMTRIDEVDYEGCKVIPIRFLKKVLPEPSSLGEGYSGKTAIGCVIKGRKAGKEVQKYIYNICDHAESFKEVQSQAISYTTGVPAMIGAMMILKGIWKGTGVFNIEQFDPDPFMEQLNKQGLPWNVVDFKGKLPE
ncbi:saccharopine dehydrogenase family protein [Candidatus Woesearchaeota archaeon]|nr:saccharopine dehydrogenase family protein [Candidatus Woesearchaeota archaeon]